MDPLATFTKQIEPGLALRRLDEHLAVVVRGFFAPDTCARWVEGVMGAREAWTEDFGGEQLSLGRAFYTHLETGRSKLYFADAAASDARVEAALPGMQSALRALVGQVVGQGGEPSARVLARPGFCGPGVHVFPASEKVARDAGVVHFDTEGLTRHHVASARRALSLVAMLKPPRSGGGLKLWDVTYQSSGGDEDVERATPPPMHVTVEYGVGDVVVFDSYRLHQIQPFSGDVARISATVHAAEVDPGVWETWF